MFTPTGTPRAIVERLSAEAKRSVNQPDFAARAEAQGTETLGTSPEELAKVVKAELAIWRKVVAKAGLKQ